MPLRRKKISEEAVAELKGMMRVYGSIELEVGAGKGRFLIERAKENPETLFIAVEKRIKYAGIMAFRVKKYAIGNTVVLNEDIHNVFADIFPEGNLFDRVFIHFPDPWWKRRHDRRYLAGEELLSKVICVLKSGGELFIQTDVFARAKNVLGLLAENQFLENLAEDGGFTDRNPFHHKTGRELACEDLGLPIFRLHFRKK